MCHWTAPRWSSTTRTAPEVVLSFPPPQLPLGDRFVRRIALGVLGSPGWFLRAITGVPPTNDRGDVLDLQTHVLGWLDRKVIGKKAASMSVSLARSTMDRSALLAAKPPPDVRAENRGLTPHVPGRIYRSTRQQGSSTPALVYVHGGGWTVGSLDSHDALCRRICHATGRLVVSVDYRMAPDHPFPTPLHDVIDAWNWVVQNLEELGGDPSDIVLAGDSAGGNLVAAACHVLRDSGDPLPSRQVLIYPCMHVHSVSESRRLFADGAFLSAIELEWANGHYQPPEHDDPMASPLLASNLAGLPPALIITAGFDPLRDEGDEYVSRLRSAGVDVEHVHAPGLVHGFMNMDGLLASADEWVGRTMEAIR